MTPDQKNLLGMAAVGVVIYLLTKKKKPADIIIGEPYDGQFPDPVTGLFPGQQSDSTGSNGSGQIVYSSGGGQMIKYVGPFEVLYDQPSGYMAGRIRQDLGKRNTN